MQAIKRKWSSKNAQGKAKVQARSTQQRAAKAATGKGGKNFGKKQAKPKTKSEQVNQKAKQRRS